jgi:enoyl-CoA hydratase
VISAINGYCLGGGLQLALACDLRIAAVSAQLGLPAVKEGLLPGMGVWRLPRIVGLGHAKQLIVSGEIIEARRARAIGLVDAVVADAALLEAAQGTAERYLRSPQTAVWLAKQMTNRAFDLPFDAFLQAYFAAQTAAMQSADHRAALVAYREERARKRQGRT